MSTEDEILRKNALLLTARERELVVLGNKHRRLLSWLSLSNALPSLFGQHVAPEEIGAQFASRIITLIKLQRVQLLELLPVGTRVYGAADCTLPAMPPPTLTWLARERYGLMNEPEGPEQNAIADLVGLQRLLWYRLELPNGTPVLLVGGFDKQRAACYPPLDPEDVEHFSHVCQHFELLLRNSLLVAELKCEKLRLEQFNEELDQKVRERTEALVHANAETTETLAALRERDARLRDDLSDARAFQQGILPRLPTHGPVEFGAFYCPLDLVGGDIYDIAVMGPGRYRLFLADATGHGIQASLRTMVVKLEYDHLKRQHANPRTLMEELNRRLYLPHDRRELLCTACCLDIELHDGGATLHYVNAAHPALVLWTKGEIVEFSDAGVFLGLADEIQFETETRDVAPGDVVIAYTDGICEQQGPDGTWFDLKRVLPRILGAEQSLSESLGELASEFEQFRGTVPLRDDVTILAARLHAEPQGDTS